MKKEKYDKLNSLYDLKMKENQDLREKLSKKNEECMKLSKELIIYRNKNTAMKKSFNFEITSPPNKISTITSKYNFNKKIINKNTKLVKNKENQSMELENLDTTELLHRVHLVDPKNILYLPQKVAFHKNIKSNHNLMIPKLEISVK